MARDVAPVVPVRRSSAWRRTIGRLLRAARDDRGLRLVDVAARARLSPQYLSEVERGLKEPSSEVLAALTDALGITLVDLAQGIVDGLAPQESRARVLVLRSTSTATSGTARTAQALVGRDVTLLAA